MPFKTKFKINKNWRQCTICNEYKQWSFYSKDKSNKYWYTNNCKDCRNILKKQYRQTWIWKIKEKNYKIIKRADKEFRKMEYKKHAEYVEKNKDKLKAKNWYKDLKLEAKKRKIREYNYYLQDEKVIYNWKICKILQDYKKWLWMLIKIWDFKIFVKKSQVKPYKEIKKYIF